MSKPLFDKPPLEAHGFGAKQVIEQKESGNVLEVSLRFATHANAL
jgi:hypothetical protein